MGLFGYVSSALSGRNRYVVWALTNACNCRCGMCGQWKQKPVIADNYKLLIDFMKKNKVLMLSLTGGEPTLHPELTEIIKYAKSSGFFVHLITNGTTMTDSLAERLKDSKINLVSVSIDHYIPEIQDKLRKHKDCHKKAVNAIKLLKEHNVPVIASTVITSLNINEIEKVVSFVNNELNVAFSVCTPSTTPDSSFFAGHSDVIELDVKQLSACTKKIIELGRKGAHICNSYEFLNEYVDSLSGNKKFYCQGGNLIYYLNPKGDFHICTNKPKLFDITSGWKTADIKCTECEVQCFKEPSVLYQISRTKAILHLSRAYRALGIKRLKK